MKIRDDGMYEIKSKFRGSKKNLKTNYTYLNENNIPYPKQN